MIFILHGRVFLMFMFMFQVGGGAWDKKIDHDKVPWLQKLWIECGYTETLNNLFYQNFMIPSVYDSNYSFCLSQFYIIMIQG